jgi:hypothetical protein
MYSDLPRAVEFEKISTSFPVNIPRGRLERIRPLCRRSRQIKGTAPVQGNFTLPAKSY